MTTIDAMGKPCPIPVIETKKILAKPDEDSVLVKVDNIVAVQNLEKMAKGYAYGFSYVERGKGSFDVLISKNGKSPPGAEAIDDVAVTVQDGGLPGKLVVAIGRDTMGDGAEELGKILIKGFIYSLTELSTPPDSLLFFNSGAYLTSDGSSTVDDLKRLEAKGTEIFSCGTCINFYGLQDRLAVGTIADMYKITQKLASAGNIINI